MFKDLSKPSQCNISQNSFKREYIFVSKVNKQTSILKVRVAFCNIMNKPEMYQDSEIGCDYFLR